MRSPHQDHGRPAAPEQPADAHGHEQHADADTHGQAMPHAHAHSAVDEDHQVHTHGEHAGHSTAMFKNKFWLSLALAIPVVVFSPMVGHLLGYSVPGFPGSTWIPPVLGTVIFVYGGAPFLKGGLTELKSRQPGMMLLIAMAITVAFVASWVTTLGIGGFDLDFWWELALLVVIMLLGHWMEMRALGAASSALDALAALLPDEAEKVVDGDTVTVPVAELAVGDVVLIRPGARVPADGEIVAGTAEFDESMITGESKAVSRAPGDTVVAGTVATDTTVRVRVEAVGADTALAGIQRMVAAAQESSSRAQALADRAAALLFWFALAAGILTAVAWTLLGSPDDAVIRTVTVLVIACPHALGLAIPLVIAISTERAAKAGVLIKDRLALERMRTIDVVLFDKTGTLTEGAHAVTGAAPVPGTSRRRPRPTASTPWPAPSSPRPPRTPRRSSWACAAPTFGRPPAAASAPRWTAPRSRSADPTCCASSACPRRRRSPGPPVSGWRAAPGCSTSSGTERSSAPWRWRTRSVPSPAPPWPPCRTGGCAWR
jgi:Cu2+-exporting ATPase